MAKISLDSIVSGFKSVSKLIANFDKIEDDLNDKVLYRDNPTGEPNQMENNLDMNSQRIVNLVSPVNDSEPARWADVKNGVTGIDEPVPSQTGNAKTPLTTNGTGLVFGQIEADHVDFTNSGTGGVERTLQAKLEDVVNVKDFGAVGDGVTDDSTSIQNAYNYARDNNKSLYIPSGLYAVGTELVFTDSVGGNDFITIDVYGDGPFSSWLVGKNAPTSLIRVNGRFITIRGLGFKGSVDFIRDTESSPSVAAIHIENMRSGGLKDIRIEHIVGAGIRIDRCIISYLENIVIYRCGSSAHYAFEQTSATQDGFQASTLRAVNVEDSHGPLGAFSMVSNRNSHIQDIAIEAQPYTIIELSTPSGQFVIGETVTQTSSGATGTVALTGSSSYTGSNGEVVLENVVGTFDAINTLSSSGGSGTAKAVSQPTGSWFSTSGEFGRFSGIYLNKNELRTSGSDLSILGDDNTFDTLKLRGMHQDKAAVVAGNRNKIRGFDIECGLTDVVNEAGYDTSLTISGNKNKVLSLSLNNCKGIELTGGRNVVSGADFRGLFNTVAILSGLLETLKDFTVDQSSAALSGPVINISGVKSKVVDGDIFNTPNATDVVQLSGKLTKAVRVSLSGCIAAFGFRTTSLGLNAEVIDCTVESSTVSGQLVNLAGVGSKVKGGLYDSPNELAIQLTADRAEVIDVSIENCSKGVFASDVDSVKIKGCTVENFSTIGIQLNPSTSSTGSLVCENIFTNPVGATQDISANSNVTDTLFTNNNASNGVGSYSLGGGTGNVSSDNI